MKKGTMIPVKKGIGAIIGLAGIGLLINPDKVSVFLCQYKPALGLLLIAAGYFLVIAGRREYY